MTEEEFFPPAEPDWTTRCKASQLHEIGPGNRYMLRTSDEPDSPWRLVKTRHHGFDTDQATGLRLDYMTGLLHDQVTVAVTRPDWPVRS